MDKTTKREIRRICQMLKEIYAFAEDREMEEALPNIVERYNGVVRHLQEKEILSGGLFRLLGEEGGVGSVSFDQVAVEIRMLMGYLHEIENEKEEDGDRKSKNVDFGPIIALAPFLEQGVLKELIDLHLLGNNLKEEKATESTPLKSPDLRSLAEMAPHLDAKDLARMLEVCLSSGQSIDPKLIAEIAPHMDRQELGRLLHRYVPGWFGEKAEEPVVATPVKPIPSPGTDLTSVASQPSSWEKPDF